MNLEDFSLKMVRIKHRCRDYKPDPATEILIIGTFNPDTDHNSADFFYGRPKNHLWTLLPAAFNEPDLKKASRNEKLAFIKKHKIGFTDLIAEISLPVNAETDYRDSFIDNKVTEWNDAISQISSLKKLNRVCFTRKTFSGVQNIKKRIEEIRQYCEEKGICFQYLITPARIYSADKQNEWTGFFS